jgi:Tol biopolymer transport system component
MVARVLSEVLRPLASRPASPSTVVASAWFARWAYARRSLQPNRPGRPVSGEHAPPGPLMRGNDAMRRGPATTTALSLALALGPTSPPPSGASATIQQVSVTRKGGDPSGLSGTFGATMSSDGRYVAFESTSGDLVAGDHTREWADIFVRDMVTGVTVRASVDRDGGDPNDNSVKPSISADGRYVAFESSATDLVPGDTNHYFDIYVRDVVAGTTVRASVDTLGGDPDWWCTDPVISPDGRYVSFQSSASDLVPGDDNGFRDTFVRDLVSGTTARVSLDTGGGDANGDSTSGTFSANGRYLAFTSWATDLVDGEDANQIFDTFVRDLATGTTVRASFDFEGGDPNGGTSAVAISAEGRYVALNSWASDLVHSFAFAMTADGRLVGWSSLATDVVDRDENGEADVFIRDLEARTSTRVSLDAEGLDANGPSWGSSMTPDGRHVAFVSEASDLVHGSDEPNKRNDVFLAELL